MNTNWHTITYLLDGIPRQQAAHRALSQLKIWEDFDAYQPVLVGTIPLEIDVATSDLDVLFHFADLTEARTRFKATYGSYPDFRMRQKTVKGIDSVIANFHAHGFEIELFAQDKPTTEQDAYRHMLIEHHLLQWGGEEAKHAIHQLKQDGMKTEPAFAHYFNIPGDDPYQALLALDMTRYRR